MLAAAAYWFCRWLALALAICLAGAAAGALLFPLAGSLLRMDLSVAEMVRNGAMDGGFYALIWAPGVAFVVVLMQAHARRNKSRPDAP